MKDTSFLYLLMNRIVLPAFYMPPLSWFHEFLKEENNVIIEQYEHFPKQTYRNRTNIYGANGKLSLFIPVRHDGKKAIKDIEISYAEKWQKQHWKSIVSAYKSSPYFEFYEDQLKSLFEEEISLLLDFNLKSISVFQKILKTNKAYSLSEEYNGNTDRNDFRNEFSAKVPSKYQFETYYQTFSDKLGFLENLSILDLVCNNGPESVTNLKKIKHL